jgi:hypothetical protein
MTKSAALAAMVFANMLGKPVSTVAPFVDRMTVILLSYRKIRIIISL